MIKIKPKTILIVGGTNRARRLTNQLQKQICSCQSNTNIRIIYALSGASEHPLKPENTTVILGKIGGLQGLRKLIKQNNIFLIIDALHPFALNMRFNLQEVAWIEKIRILHLKQKFWIPKPGDAWLAANNTINAIKQISNYSFRRPFITLGGRLTLEALNLIQNSNIETAFCRGLNWKLNSIIGASDNTEAIDYSYFTKIQFISKSPPYTYSDDFQFIKTHKCDVIVAKNSGQPAAFGKIIAARKNSCPVILVTQPQQSFGATYSEIFSVLNNILKQS